MTNPRIAIDIVANDKSGKGVAGAEKRIGSIPQHAGIANRRMLRDGEREIGRSSGSMLRTLGSVERASSRVFGGRSMTDGLSNRLGALREVASSTGSGLSEAAASGGLLEGAMAGIGVAVGATIGIVAAAGFAAFKLADGWAKGAASIGRTADTIGVSTKALQEFSAAAERAGVDKDKAVGSLGGLSQTLNDARYGRNTAALSVLGRIGVGMKTNADGTVDVGAMLPQIAEAISRYNSSGRRTIAKNLGIDLSTLPAFTGGGKKLSADMSDADTHAVVLDAGQIATGTRIARKGTMVGQLADRAMSAAGSATAGVTERGYDAVLSGGKAIVDGAASFGSVVKRTFAPAADKIAAGGRAIERAAAGLTASAIGAAQRAAAKWHIPASVQLAQAGFESNYGKNTPAGSNNPFGIKARKGQPSVMAWTHEGSGRNRVRVLQPFRVYDNQDQAYDDHARLLARGKAMRAFRAKLPDARAAVYELGGGTTADPRYATGDRKKYGDGMVGIMRRDHLERYDGAPIPVAVTVDMRGAPPGTRATAKAGHGSRPAISHALAHS